MADSSPVDLGTGDPVSPEYRDAPAAMADRDPRGIAEANARAEFHHTL